MIESKKIISLKEIVNDYDFFFIDQWGVMHDGHSAYKNSLNCINKLFNLGKKLIIISNSSNRKKESIKRLKHLGFNEKNFQDVITSGEIVWQEINFPTLKGFKNLGNKCFFLSYDSDNKNNLSYGLNKKIVKNIESADFILASKADPSTSVIDYIPILKKAIDKKLPLICANPDFESIEVKNKERNICMGAISKLYEELGGTQIILGKPSTFIYKKSVNNLKDFKKSRALAIGDSMYHDIAGAKKFGIKSLLITSGIHSDSFSKNDLNLINQFEALNAPDFIAENLIF